VAKKEKSCQYCATGLVSAWLRDSDTLLSSLLDLSLELPILPLDFAGRDMKWLVRMKQDQRRRPLLANRRPILAPGRKKQ
jgi:hypothetical protein